MLRLYSANERKDKFLDDGGYGALIMEKYDVGVYFERIMRSIQKFIPGALLTCQMHFA